MSRKNFSVLLTVCAVMVFLSVCSSAYASAITGELPDGKVGERYGAPFLYYEGIYGSQTWSVSEGSLPPGLELRSSTGMVTGTPTQAGTYTFTILVRVRGHSMTETDSVTREFTITILPNAEVRDPVISGTFPAGKTTVPYSESIYAADGRSPYTWSYSGNLPDGLTLKQGSDSDIYTLSGTPARNGTYTFTVTVTDSYSHTASKEMTVTIGDDEGKKGEDDDDLTIGGTFPEGSVGTSYSESIYVNEGESPYTWSYTGSLPEGLYLSSSYSSYTLSGTPTKAGTYTFTVTVTDGNGKTASKEITITITGGSNGNNGNDNNGNNGNNGNNDNTNNNTGGNTGNNTNNNTNNNGNTNNNDNTDDNTTNNNGGLNPNQNGGDGSQNVQINTGGGGGGGCQSGSWTLSLILAFAGLSFIHGKKEEI